jgi:hypothetical protein
MIKHGMTANGNISSEHRIWTGIKQRCYNRNNKDYSKYGGRGIRMCKRWYYSFKAFYDDMGPRPTNASIDRIDNDKGYNKGNCRWATKEEQANNMSINNNHVMNGESKSIAQWCRIYNVHRTTISNRLKYGWNIKDALTINIKSKGSRSRL